MLSHCCFRHVYGWTKPYTLAHDSYFCGSYHDYWKPFPTEREAEGNNFVGGLAGKGGIPQAKGYECPEKCRGNKTWTYC